MKRPEYKHSHATTPRVSMMMELLGPGATSKSVVLSTDEFKAIKKLYNYQPEDDSPIMQAGADRNAIREAECDGLRIAAWIAKFVPANEDPLKTVIQLAADAGYDVPYEDLMYAENEPI